MIESIFENLFKPLDAAERWDRIFDKSLLKDNGDGTYDYDGRIYLTDMNLSSLHDIPYKLRRVTGAFYCSDNQLASLEGAPQEVGGAFYCSDNQLASLEGAPQEVGGAFYCSDNQLASLEGAPQKVGGHFHCSGNQLSSLKGAPQKVGGSFHCSGNKLSSLELKATVDRDYLK